MLGERVAHRGDVHQRRRARRVVHQHAHGLHLRSRLRSCRASPSRGSPRSPASRSSPDCVRATFSRRMRSTCGSSRGDRRRRRRGPRLRSVGACRWVERGASHARSFGAPPAPPSSCAPRRGARSRNRAACLELAGLDEVEQLQVLGALAHDLLAAALGAVLEQAAQRVHAPDGVDEERVARPAHEDLVEGGADLEDLRVGEAREAAIEKVALALAQPLDRLRAPGGSRACAAPRARSARGSGSSSRSPPTDASIGWNAQPWPGRRSQPALLRHAGEQGARRACAWSCSGAPAPSP